MRFSLRTLLIVFTLLPALIWAAWKYEYVEVEWYGPVENYWVCGKPGGFYNLQCCSYCITTIHNVDGIQWTEFYKESWVPYRDGMKAYHRDIYYVWKHK